MSKSLVVKQSRGVYKVSPRFKVWFIVSKYDKGWQAYRDGDEFATVTGQTRKEVIAALEQKYPGPWGL